MTVEITTLPGGLRVATELNSAVESVSLGVWVDVGTRYESKRFHGISHLLEHMVFKGTARRTAAEIAEEIEAVGGHINAYTSREHTTYYARVLKEDIKLALDILSDILLKSTFDEAELKREQEVILQEIGQVHDAPDELVFDLLQKRAYPKQSLGRPILGTEKSVSSFGCSDLKEFMAPHYTAENMLLVASGNLDHKTFTGWAGEYFSTLPHNGKSTFEGASYAGGEARAKRRLEQLHLTLGFESCSYLDPDYFAAQVYTTILGGGMSSRLFQEVREKRGFAYSVYAFNAALRDTGLLNIYAGTAPEHVSELIPVVAGEMQSLTGKIPEAEIARAQAQMRAGLLMTLESTSSRVEQIGRQILVYGRPLAMAELVEKIDAVGEKEVNEIAAKLLKKPMTLAGIGAMETVPDFEKVQDTFMRV